MAVVKPSEEKLIICVHKWRLWGTPGMYSYICDKCAKFEWHKDAKPPAHH